MSDYENDRRSAESSRIGAEGGRISAESGRVSADQARVTADEHRHTHRVRKDVGQIIAYLLIVGIAVIGFIELGKANDRICETAAENRAAIQNVVDGVSRLGTNLVSDGKPPEELDAEDRAGLVEIDKFRTNTLSLLDQPVC